MTAERRRFYMSRLPRLFFEQPTLNVARDLLGKRLIFDGVSGIITETEAYIGREDPACHAARGKTKRTAVMFGPAGFSYVYLIYGMYHCMNIVTEQDGFPAAVLIRGLFLEEPALHLDGPGKLCRHLRLTREHSGLDLVTSPSFFVEETSLSPAYKTTPRIGIRLGTEKLWRFVMNDTKDLLSKEKNGSTKTLHLSAGKILSPGS